MTLTSAQRDDLIAAMDSYPVLYDEVFFQVNERLKESGEAGKLDIAAITFWKRVRPTRRWVEPLMLKRDVDVRAVTREAFASGRHDRAALRALAALPGYGNQGPLATALLCAWDPEHFAVMDVHAHNGLKMLGLGVDRGSGEAIRYLEQARKLRDELRPDRPRTTARDVDKGLYLLGKRG